VTRKPPKRGRNAGLGEVEFVYREQTYQATFTPQDVLPDGTGLLVDADDTVTVTVTVDLLTMNLLAHEVPLRPLRSPAGTPAQPCHPPTVPSRAGEAGSQGGAAVWHCRHH
jgi:hypothetical protein